MDNDDGRTLERPLNAADIQNLRVNLNNIEAVLRAAKKAASAGVDVTEQVKAATEAKEKIQKLLAAYG